MTQKLCQISKFGPDMGLANMIFASPMVNGEEIAFENGRISDFQGLMTLTLTLYRVILHTVMHHSSTTLLGRLGGRGHWSLLSPGQAKNRDSKNWPGHTKR